MIILIQNFYCWRWRSLPSGGSLAFGIAACTERSRWRSLSFGDSKPLALASA